MLFARWVLKTEPVRKLTDQRGRLKDRVEKTKKNKNSKSAFSASPRRKSRGMCHTFLVFLFVLYLHRIA